VAGEFTVRFLSPDGDEGPRVYYIEPLIHHWIKDKPTTFVEDACNYGRKILAVFDSQSADAKQDYQRWHTLFRQRNKGHMHIATQFLDPVDFVDFLTASEPELITPGISPSEQLVAAVTQNIGSSQRSRARRLLSGALNPRDNDPLCCRAMLQSSGPNAKHRAPNLRGVLDAYDALFAVGTVALHPGRQHRWLALDMLPDRSDLDVLFTDGWQRLPERWAFSQAIQKVRSALIYCSDWDIPIDLPRAKQFMHSLEKRFQGKAFDQKWKHAREHSFLPFIHGGTRLVGREKEEAALQAQRFACELMWLAYQRMARCWGVLMMLAEIDFGLNNEAVPTAQERWLFRQWHFPQIYLGGLPLGFLGRAQLRWIIRKLHELWGQAITDPARYAEVTDLLWFFGSSVRRRRAADEKRPPATKAKKANPGDKLPEEKPPKRRPAGIKRPQHVDVEVWDSIPARDFVSEDVKCPVCHEEASVLGPGLYCEQCDAWLPIAEDESFGTEPIGVHGSTSRLESGPGVPIRSAACSCVS